MTTLRRTWTLICAAALTVALALWAAPISHSQQPAPPAPAPSAAAPMAPDAAAPMAPDAAEEEHDHTHGFQSDTGARRNLTGPVVMIVAGALYFGYVRWTTERRRAAARAAR